MKQFKIKTSLAAGLTHRLNTIDAQTVIDACGLDAIEAVRFNQRIIKKIEESNKVFIDAVMEIEGRKRIVFNEIQAEYKALGEELPAEEKAKAGRDLTAKFNAASVEIQKESKAQPDEIITVEISDEDYEKVLLPVFKKTAQLWDVEGNGNGQSLFLEVAESLTAVETV